MPAALLFRLSSRAASALMGGFAVFCLYYAGRAADPKVVWYLLTAALQWGGGATVIAYFQGKYLGK
jgi:hypothetical protein